VCVCVCVCVCVKVLFGMERPPKSGRLLIQSSRWPVEERIADVNISWLGVLKPPFEFGGPDFFLKKSSFFSHVISTYKDRPLFLNCFPPFV